MANSEDPDKMPQQVACHQCLHCFLRPNGSSEKEIQYFFLNFNLCTMDHPDKDSLFYVYLWKIPFV